MLDLRGFGWQAAGHARGRVLAHGLDAQILPGQRWAVLGPNGSGKSTLLATLAGLLPVTMGQVLLQGRPLSAWSVAELARQRAWCPTTWADPFPATVLDTLALAALEPARPGMDEAALLERLDLMDLAARDVRSLSAGERQRVSLACALRQGGSLLLLDEPTAHLDLAHRLDLIDELVRWTGQGGAAVASLHDLDVAATWATHAIVLLPGGAVVSGPSAQTLQPAVLSAAFGVEIHAVDVCGQRRLWIGGRVSMPAPEALGNPGVEDG